MAVHRIKRGLELPIIGAPAQSIRAARPVQRVAVLNDDYPLMKPRMAVAVGDVVKRGSLLFDDRKAEGVRHCSPASGTVVAVNRGDRRKLESVVIELNEREQSGKLTDADHEAFGSYVAGKSVDQLGGEQVRALLVDSGLWTALRVRPFDRNPAIAETPRSIFVTAIDTNPLAVQPEVALEGKQAHFEKGLYALSKLTEGKIFLCVKRGSSIGNPGNVPRVQVEQFDGPHPAGLVGTHIHLLDPVSRSRTVWYVGYQDVAAIGELFATGKINPERIVSVAGPSVLEPAVVRTRLGADVAALTTGNIRGGEQRIVSGSVFYGAKATNDVVGYLGRFSNQITVLAEDRARVFLGWLAPGGEKFSTIRAFGSRLLMGTFGGKKFDFTTTTHGGHRAMVPIGMYERVMPLDILPTFLLRALLTDDTQRAESLGALELGEEDLALCTFVCPGKDDYGVALRRNLTQIWKEG